MSVPAHCPNCDLSFISRGFLIENASNITFEGCQETCPRCGGFANIQDGTYDFVGRVITAFRAPGVSWDDIIEFQSIAAAVNSGELSKEQADARVEQIGASLAGLWKWINDNSGALTLVVTVIHIYLAIHLSNVSNAVSEQQHTDAARLSQSIERQTEALETATELQQKIYEALEQQPKANSVEASQASRPRPKMYHISPQQRPNRHERRKARTLARRQSNS